MSGLEFPTIETRRLVLRPLALSDAPAIYAYQSDAEVYRYLSADPPTSADVVAEPIGRWLALPAEDRRPCWVIVLREIDCIVGTISFNQLDRKNASGQLGFDVAREQWGKGIGTEAVRAVISHGFDTMGLNRITAYCWEGNMASQRVMEKAGMTYEGTLRQPRYAKGAYRDMRLYSVLASEWKAGQGAQGSPGDKAGDS